MNQYHADTITYQCRIKALQAQVDSFRSGKRYEDLMEACRQDIRVRDAEIRRLKKELSDAFAQMVKNRNHWFEVYEDIEKEHSRQMRGLEKDKKKLADMLCQQQRCNDELKNTITELNRKNRALEEELENEKDKNRKLMAQLNHDYENSSKPSSMDPNHKKISNSREKTGRKPGGQPGHKGHCRKRQTPTEVVMLPDPPEVQGNTKIRFTGKECIKQLVSIRLAVETTEYRAKIFYNPEKKEYIHAKFPEGVVNDINYDGSIRAFLYLLNNDCCTSMDKAGRFLSDLSGGRLNISKGMISSLVSEFAEKSKQQQTEQLGMLLKAPVVHADCTNARVNGKAMYVYVCAEPDGAVLYFAREKKGHKGIEGSVIEDYQGIIVHDHDTTFYRYGTGHQECSAHILRYLKDSMENEPDRSWNRDMYSLMKEMIHYRNGLADVEEPDADTVSDFEKRYRGILDTAEKEYSENPPGKYYTDGRNLYRRMKKYMDNHLLFLHDIRVPSTNNRAERLLRAYKRKQKQAMSFRSFESIEALCSGMSVLCLLRRDEESNLFKRVSELFS